MDATATTHHRVAVVGAGVSGLAAAWHLHTSSSTTTSQQQQQQQQAVSTEFQYDVHVFEKEPRLGGHAYTLPKVDGIVDVDIGFMVYNEHNYPNMTEWFQELQVTSEDSDMSLSVSLDQGRTVEWNSDGLNGLYARRAQILQPSFYTHLVDMMRFHRHASELLRLNQDDPRRHVSVRSYLRTHGYSAAFSKYYLLPMMAALWSASMEEVMEFPAQELIGFLCNHQMLQLLDRPTWKTVKNRSQSYTGKMQDILGDAVHLSTPIVHVQKQGSQYELFTTHHTSVGLFDHVIFACHPPTSRDLLQGVLPPTDPRMEALGAMEYADNTIYVHSDPKLMPLRKRAWASWNCLGKTDLIERAMGNGTIRDSTTTTSVASKGGAFEGAESGFGNKVSGGEQKDHNGPDQRMKAVYVTYWLNRLQNLATPNDIFVSLNPHESPAPALTYQRLSLAHPQFTTHTLSARNKLLSSEQGKDNLWFCGAWGGYGFHEDGCRSGFQVATKLSKIPLPWAKKEAMVLPPPDMSLVKPAQSYLGSLVQYVYQTVTYELPVALCKRFICTFMSHAVKKGRLELKFNDGSIITFGDGSQCGCDASPVTLRVFDPWFFVKTALEYDLGLARSYMAGYFVVEALEDPSLYDPVIRPPDTSDETTTVLGDPVGLMRLFMLLIGNRDSPENHLPRKAGRGHWYSNALTNASGLVVSRIGSLLNFLRYKLTMDNSERGGSLKNIHAHYDLSNDLFKTFLDKETLMYSSAIYDGIQAPEDRSGLIFRGTLEEAQWRKLDTLLSRAQIQPGQTMLDVGFGWGGLSLHAAKKYGCKVTGITLSVEQKALAEERVKLEGLGHLISFEVVDYRTFARRKENQGKFDRVLSCEMIEAVGHEHLGEFFWAVEQVLAHDGILCMEAITTPEQRYETYRRSTDFINTIIFPGSCCPSLHALVDAAYQQSCLTLEHISNIGLHYARTLAEWRRRFNAREDFVRKLGFDDVFLRVWNYYLTYCEAGFHSQTENCLILVFSRQGCKSLAPLCETRSVTQPEPFSNAEIQGWVQ